MTDLGQSSSVLSDSTIKTSIESQQSADEEPLAKDEGFSPTDIECQIQAERINKSLDKAVYLTKLTLCLPVLIKRNILSKILTRRHLEDVCYVFNLYQKPLSSHSLLNMTAIEDLQTGDKSLKHRLNSDMSCMLQILNSYPALKPRVERLTENMKQEFKTRPNRGGNDAKKPPAGLAYLLKLEEFRDLMVVRMKKTAAEEISAIKRVKRLEKSNTENLAKIAEYSKSFKEEKEDMEEQMRDKTELIAQLTQEIAISNHQAEKKRKQQILDSERQMVLANRAHVVKYQMLKEEELESQEIYEKSINDNLTVEKQLRDRRRKAETQLQGWLQKYDVDMRSKQEDLDEVTGQYEDEVDKVKELERQLEEQNVEYEKLMAEREEEYHQEMTTKMNEFTIEHAARVIQIAWRDVQRNRAEKAKLMKLKKKQEMERQAAARRAESEAKRQALEEKKRAAQEKREANEAARAEKLGKKTGPSPKGQSVQDGQAEQGNKEGE